MGSHEAFLPFLVLFFLVVEMSDATVRDGGITVVPIFSLPRRDCMDCTGLPPRRDYKGYMDCTGLLRRTGCMDCRDLPPRKGCTGYTDLPLRRDCTGYSRTRLEAARWLWKWRPGLLRCRCYRWQRGPGSRHLRLQSTPSWCRSAFLICSTSLQSLLGSYVLAAAIAAFGS
ncbi:hypothetical protein DFP90_107167 [Aestuariispira insulae]|uniref:Uncharacterized protein n=1 Tax=Aestuariispira insulae TaxID=1461337 RepID=A0A3D9HGN3_9PROT|nr:hypothetical protein DFP90_107167 [Aestuariispira insulae]